MPAVEALGELGIVIVWLVAFGVASIGFYIGTAIGNVLDIGIAGTHPFRGVARALTNYIVEPLDDLRKKSDAEIAKGLSGLLDALFITIALPVLVALGVKAALDYLWNVALQPLVRSMVKDIRSVANEALGKVTALADDVADYPARWRRYAEGQATDALDKAKAYADADLRVAKADAIRYADEAVSKLRTAEDAAVANAVKLAGDALAGAEAADRALINGIGGAVIGIGDDLATIEGKLTAGGVALLLASIPALATLTQTIAVESGLENAECRQKVKQVCTTDPKLWSQLLGGLVPLGLLYGLRELEEASLALVDVIAPAVREVATLTAQGH